MHEVGLELLDEGGVLADGDVALLVGESLIFVEELNARLVGNGIEEDVDELALMREEHVEVVVCVHRSNLQVDGKFFDQHHDQVLVFVLRQSLDRERQRVLSFLRFLLNVLREEEEEEEEAMLQGRLTD